MKLLSSFPGTQVPVSTVGLLKGIFSATTGVTLSQVCEITGLEASSIHNWIKRGYVGAPVGRKYTKSQLARIILINMLRDTLAIEKIARLLSYVNGDLVDASDDLMDDSDLYECLCNILVPADQKEVWDMKELFSKIDEHLAHYSEPYQGARSRIALALKAIVCAYESANLKRYVDLMTENI